MINFLKKTEELFPKKRHLTYQLPNRLKNLTFIPINNLFAGYIFYESWTDAVVVSIQKSISKNFNLPINFLCAYHKYP